MLTIRYQSRFRRDFKRMVKRGYDVRLLEPVIELLASGQQLPPEYRDHGLRGRYSGCRECHITPDWLLVYEIVGSGLVLMLMRTGTHSDLFDE